MNNIPKISALAFDLDGTLANSIPDLTDAANVMRAHFGKPALDEAKIQSYIGDGVASLVHRALIDDEQNLLSDENWQAGYVSFIQHYHQNIAKKTKLYPGVKTGLELLNKLRLPLAVITNKSERLTLPLLEKLGIRDSFSLVLGGDSLNEKKPSALPLSHTCEVFGINTENLAMVGDSSNDINAARAAGSYAIAVDYGYQNAKTLNADLVISNITKLYDLLSKNS